jgi:hypothetical protein
VFFSAYVCIRWCDHLVEGLIEEFGQPVCWGRSVVDDGRVLFVSFDFDIEIWCIGFTILS